MVFYRYQILFVGIPKTGTSSIFDTLYNEGDDLHNHSPIWDIERRHPNENFDDFYRFAVIRNPYDRFVSMAHQYFRDQNGDNTRDCNKVAQYLVGKNAYELRVLNEMFVPQWWFLCDENGDLKIKNFWLFERLEATYEKFSADFNKRNKGSKNLMPKFLAQTNISYARKDRKWRDEINNETIAIINELYSRDFEMFGFNKILP